MTHDVSLKWTLKFMEFLKKKLLLSKWISNWFGVVSVMFFRWDKNEKFPFLNARYVKKIFGLIIKWTKKT